MAFIKRKKQQVIDYDAIRQASTILGLKHKVKVTRLSKSNDKWWGEYSPLHVIAYAPCVPREDISHVLWHELGHAMQCERDYHSDGSQYLYATHFFYQGLMDSTGNPRIARGQRGFEEWEQQYYQIPIEAEAEDIAVRYADRYPLIK